MKIRLKLHATCNTLLCEKMDVECITCASNNTIKYGHIYHL